MADARDCEQCGTVFAPRREHARFCSARCRVAWNRETASDPVAEVSALGWSISAMRDATGRLLRVRAWDQPRAFTVISEAVWWVTIVDGTLVRYHPDAYDAVLGGQAPAKRQLIEGTLAGLRFVRNRMGDDMDHADFIHQEARRSRSGDGRINTWTWKSVPEPALELLSPRGRAWEMTRYRAYEAHLAGHTVRETFGRAAEFLKQAAAKATSAPDYGTAAGERASPG